MLNFDLLEKGLELDSPPQFVYDFSINFFSCYIAITFCYYILEILGDMSIVIIGLPNCDDINFEIKLSYQVAFIYDRELRTKI